MKKYKIIEKIDKMHIETTGKKILRDIFYLTSNSNLSVKQTVSSLLLCTSEKESGYEFARVYAEILNANKVFYQESHSTYMELEYYPEMTENDRRHFFQSIRNAALTCNRFWGVLVIDICDWDENEISSSKLFLQLLEYLRKNEKNIRTIFVSRLGITGGEKAIQTIGKYVSINQLNLGYPEIEEIVNYAKKYIQENDLELNEDGLEELENYIHKLQINKKYERDELVRTLSQIVYYWKKDENNLENTLIAGEYLEKLLPKVNSEKEKNRIGFHI